MALHLFHMPAAIDLRPGGACRRRGTCDALPCHFGAKGDAETRLLAPALAHPNVTLWSEARVTRLIAHDHGARIVAAEIEHSGETFTVRAPLFVLSAGALNSALLLRSADGRNPHVLANGSGVVGRHFMNHHLTGLMRLMPFTANETRHIKPLAFNDFYFGASDDPVPLGNIQMFGNIQEPTIRSAHPRLPRPIDRWQARHSVDFLVMSEDLPHWDSTIRPLPGDRAELIWQPINRAPHRRFVARTKKLLHDIGFPVVLTHGFGIECPSHQCARYAWAWIRRRRRSILAAGRMIIPALYVVDAGLFPSSAAVNPALTVAAQTLRVGRHLREHWFGASAWPPRQLPFPSRDLSHRSFAMSHNFLQAGGCRTVDGLGMLVGQG